MSENNIMSELNKIYQNLIDEGKISEYSNKYEDWQETIEHRLKINEEELVEKIKEAVSLQKHIDFYKKIIKKIED